MAGMTRKLRFDSSVSACQTGEILASLFYEEIRAWDALLASRPRSAASTFFGARHTGAIYVWLEVAVRAVKRTFCAKKNETVSAFRALRLFYTETEFTVWMTRLTFFLFFYHSRWAFSHTRNIIYHQKIIWTRQAIIGIRTITRMTSWIAFLTSFSNWVSIEAI